MRLHTGPELLKRFQETPPGEELHLTPDEAKAMRLEAVRQANLAQFQPNRRMRRSAGIRGRRNG